ncbi:MULTISPECIES: Card1-like endonuclease domain-containing protein [unclassified Microcoleus]|uniref:Card1-like endonuclease domain-containing protein n=1 Tax=unclassified Microcoleus TaxID=2642155 RepID=UPI002FCEDFD5
MTSNNPLDWEYHQVDHLFLLIGENPLPNYVAAKTLLREGGKPYLVYTEYTCKAYKRLKEVLCPNDEEKIEFENQKVELWNYESNAFEIQKAIKDKVKELQKRYPDKKRFGLNYTGGTKAMAVHAYQALLDLKLSPEPIFSYLDSRSLQMIFDRTNALPIPLEVPHEKLEITGETLFSLHGLYWKQGKKPINKPKLVEAATKIVNLYMNDNQRNSFDNAWLDWCNNVLTPTTQKQNKYGKYIDWKEEEHLEKNIELDLTAAPEVIKKVLKDSLGASSDKLSLQTAKQSGQFDKFYHVCEWLNCGWLEHYVLDQIQKISVNPPIDASAMSFNIIDQPDDNWEKFQFDVAFRRSYQLFAISCTTSRATDRCKEKLFEAYIRAKQLGGSEARVALVCFHNKPGNIIKTFNSLIEDPKIAVFGNKHLKKISAAITNWIEGKSY